MKLKLLFWLLLIGNGILFGMQHGYLGATTAERHEPQRLVEQLRPESLAILPPNSEKLAPPVRPQGVQPQPDAPAKPEQALGVAPAATTPAVAAAAASPVSAPAPQKTAAVSSCTEVGNFTAADARRFSSQLASLNLGDKLVQKLTQDITSYMVYIPPQDGRDGAERRKAELRRLGIGDVYMIPENSPNPALRYGISLGIFRTEEAGKAYIGQLIAQGVRSARIIARRSGAGKQVFQLHDLTPDARAALDKIRSAFPDQEVRACSA